MKRISENPTELPVSETLTGDAQDRHHAPPAPIAQASPEMHTHIDQRGEIRDAWMRGLQPSDIDEENSWDECTRSVEQDDREDAGTGNFTRSKLFIRNTDAHLEDWLYLLQGDTKVNSLTIECQLDISDPWEAFSSIFAALRNNLGLKKIFIDARGTTSEQASTKTFPLSALCDALRDHPRIEKVFIDELLTPLNTSLNHELQASHSKLRHLSLKISRSQQELDQFAEALQKNSWLKSIRLTFDAESATDCYILCTALRNHPTLQTVHIRLPQSISASEALIHSASHIPLIRKITFEDIDDQHAIMIAALIANAKTLRKLNLQSINFSDSAERKIESALLQNFSIKHFYFSESRNGLTSELANMRLGKASKYVTDRNEKLTTFYAPLQAGYGISAGMEILGKPEFRNAILPVEIGALIAREVAINLPPEQTIEIFRSLSL